MIEKKAKDPTKGDVIPEWDNFHTTVEVEAVRPDRYEDGDAYVLVSVQDVNSAAEDEREFDPEQIVEVRP